MVRPRQSHTSKSQAEKRIYWQKVIRAPAGPTLEDTAPVIDTTDQMAITEETQPPAYALTKPPSSINKFLHDKGLEILIGIVMLGLLGWGAGELYTLNREVGQLTSNLNNVEKAQSQINTEIEKVEQRFVEQVEKVSSDIDRLERRIDGLLEIDLQSRKSISK